MKITYHSTRNKDITATASEAILNGIAPDGGLYVPDEIPKLKVSFEALARMDYAHVAYDVMYLFFTDFTEETLKAFWEKATSMRIFDLWITHDVRPGREVERWINLLARRV